MKDIFKFVIFLIYTVLIFLIKRCEMLFICFFINIFLMYALKINLKKALRYLIRISPFIIFTAIINAVVIDVNTAILISVRLFLVCNVTYTFSKVFSYIRLAKVIEKLFYFTKFIGINPKDISLLVCIAIAFIPILRNQIIETKYSIRAKGLKLNLKNSNIIFIPFIASIMRRIEEIENSLKARGYQSN